MILEHVFTVTLDTSKKSALLLGNYRQPSVQQS